MNGEYLSLSEGQRLADMLSELSKRMFELQNEKNSLLYAVKVIWQSAEAHDPELGLRIQQTLLLAAENCERYGDNALDKYDEDARLAAETKERFYATAAGLRLIAQKDEPVSGQDEPRAPSFTVVTGGKTQS